MWSGIELSPCLFCDDNDICTCVKLEFTCPSIQGNGFVQCVLCKNVGVVGDWTHGSKKKTFNVIWFCSRGYIHFLNWSAPTEFPRIMSGTARSTRVMLEPTVATWRWTCYHWLTWQIALSLTQSTTSLWASLKSRRLPRICWPGASWNPCLQLLMPRDTTSRFEADRDWVDTCAFCVLTSSVCLANSTAPLRVRDSFICNFCDSSASAIPVTVLSLVCSDLLFP